MRPDLEFANGPRMIRPVVGFFVHYQRNAWHSTRVARYEPGALIESVRRTEDWIDRRTVQGSTFYVEPLPMFELIFLEHSIVVADINCRNPFSQVATPSPEDLRCATAENVNATFALSSTLAGSEEDAIDRVVWAQVSSGMMEFSQYSTGEIGSSLREMTVYRRTLKSNRWEWTKVETAEVKSTKHFLQMADQICFDDSDRYLAAQMATERLFELHNALSKGWPLTRAVILHQRLPRLAACTRSETVRRRISELINRSK